MSKRDNFPAAVKKELADRVGYLCSNPACWVTTVGPAIGTSGRTRTGVAAHINAAAPKGPRYKATQTKAERISVDNGIWLCANCSRKVDDDRAGHSEVTLRMWRMETEAEASRRLLNPALTAQKVQEQMKGMLQALPSAQAKHAVSNIHKAAEAYLSSLDGRFRVTSSYVSGAQTLELSALEEVPFELELVSSDPDVARDAMYAAWLHGDSAAFEVSKLRMTGSPLLEHLTSEEGAALVEITAVGQPAMVKLHLTPPDSASATESICLDGDWVAGSHSRTVNASAFGGAIVLKIRQFVRGDQVGKIGLGLSLNCEQWGGRDVRFLPHLSAACDFLAKIFSGWRVEAEAFAEKHSVRRMEITTLAELPAVRFMRAVLAYARNAQIVATMLNKPIRFIDRHPLVKDEFEALSRAARASSGQISADDHDEVGEIEFDVENSATSRYFIPEVGGVVSVICIPPAGEDLNIYGESFTLPPLIGTVHCEVLEVAVANGEGRIAVKVRKVMGMANLYSFLSPGETLSVDVRSRLIPGGSVGIRDGVSKEIL